MPFPVSVCHSVITRFTAAVCNLGPRNFAWWLYGSERRSCTIRIFGYPVLNFFGYFDFTATILNLDLWKLTWMIPRVVPKISTIRISGFRFFRIFWLYGHNIESRLMKFDMNDFYILQIIIPKSMSMFEFHKIIPERNRSTNNIKY